MKNIRFFSTSLLLTIVLSWQACNTSDPTPKNPNFYELETGFVLEAGFKPFISDIAFINDNEGVIVGNSGFIAKTTEGGNSWAQLITNTRATFSLVDVPSKLNTFYAGYYELYKTEDGGISFQTVPVNSNYVRGLHFINDNVGMLNLNGTIYRTGDAGITWSKVYEQAPSNDFVFSTENIGYCGGLIKTVDGGQTWNYVGESIMSNIPFDERYIGELSFINENIGYCTVTDIEYINWRDYEFHNSIYKTTDGGITWQQINDEIWGGLLFLTENEGYLYRSSEIWYTVDGGVNWELEYVTPYGDNGLQKGIQKMIKTTNHIYAVGDEDLILKKDL